MKHDDDDERRNDKRVEEEVFTNCLPVFVKRHHHSKGCPPGMSQLTKCSIQGDEKREKNI